MNTYLKRMGIDVWTPRDTADEHRFLARGPQEPVAEPQAIQPVTIEPEQQPVTQSEPSHPIWQSVALPSVPANETGDYLIVCADAVTEEGVKESAHPFSGQTASLFDGMVKATKWDVNRCVLLHDVSQFNTACEAVQPKIIVLLGLQAVRALHSNAQNVDALIAKQSMRLPKHNGIPYVCTFHPNLAVQDAQYKRPIWEDLKRAMSACV